MSEAGKIPPKSDPETLVLRAAPRRIVRFKRNILIGIAAVGAAVIAGTTWFALRSTTLIHHQTEDELYSTGPKRLPDAMSALPSSYDHIKLGSPLPGDLGKPVVDRERALGLNPTETSFEPNPEDDATRAERIRLAQQARQASEAGVMFQVSNQAGAAAPALAPAASGPTGAASTTPTSPDNLNIDPTRDPNFQGHKLELVNGKADKDIYNPHALQQPASPYELLAGTVISASLITGLNSDLPGTVIAQVTDDEFDSPSGRTLLLARGSKIIGRYDSVIAFGQSRALVVWQRIVMPNGTSIQIDNQPATDASGYAGLEDDVDYHTWTLLKGIAMSTILGVGSQISFGSNNSDLVEAIRQSTQESANQAGQQIVQKDISIQPTITIRPGWDFRILLSKDVVLAPYQE
jgi:type IV secretory pathway VirB10-like protein